MELTGRMALRMPPAEKRSVLTLIMFGLLFVGWVGEWPLEIDPVMYLGKWRSVFVVFAPLFTPVPGISLFPWQILLFALVPFCLATTGARRHAPEMDQAIVVSIACIVVTFLWGWAHGGSPYFAYYQVWRFLAALLIGYMLMSLMRSERDLVTLGKIVVLAALIRATLCMYFYWTYVNGKIFPVPEFVTNHDDSILWVVAILIVTVWACLKREKITLMTAALVVPYLLYAVILNTRRIAWVELGLALPLYYLLIPAGPLRSRVNKWLIRAAPLVVIYVVAGLGSDSAVFAPVHALATTGSNYDPSSLTRQEEARNLLHTLVDVGNPIFGTGWGRPYDKIESYWSNYNAEWVLTLYTPHNAILGLAAFAGLLGIVGIWGVVPVGAYLAARGYRGSTNPVARAGGAVAIGTLVAYSVHCYGDIGLQSFAVSLSFGAALATAGKVAVWREAPPAALSPPAGGRKAAASRRAVVAPSPRPRSPSATGSGTRPSRAPGRLSR